MVDAQQLKVYDNLSDVMPNTDKELVKGQVVDVVNGYGCKLARSRYWDSVILTNLVDVST